LETPDILIVDDDADQRRTLCLLLDKTLQIVMVTSHQEVEIAKSALDSGAISYITKPLDADFICGEVARLLSPPADEVGGGRPWRIAK
jgi:DNA-binding NtrC family response regulator